MQITCKVWPKKPRRGSSAEATPAHVTDGEPKHIVACAAGGEETVRAVVLRVDAKLSKKAGTKPGYLDPYQDEVLSVKKAIIDFDDTVDDLFEHTTLEERELWILQSHRPEPKSKKRGAPNSDEQRTSKKARTDVLTPSSIPAEQSASQEAPTSAQRPPLTQPTPTSAQAPQPSARQKRKSNPLLRSSQRQPVGLGETKVNWTADEDAYLIRGLTDGLDIRHTLETYGIKRTRGAARARKMILVTKGLLPETTAAAAGQTGSQNMPNSTPNSGLLDLASSPPVIAPTQRAASPQVVIPATSRTEDLPSQGRPPQGRPSQGRPSQGRPSRGRPSQGRPSRPSQSSRPFLGGRSGSSGRQTTLDFWSSDPSRSHILSDDHDDTQVVPSSVPPQPRTRKRSMILTHPDSDEELEVESIHSFGAKDAADDTFVHIDEVVDEDHQVAVERNEEATRPSDGSDGEEEVQSDRKLPHSSTSNTSAAINTRSAEHVQSESIDSPMAVKIEPNDISSTDGHDDLEQVAGLSAQEALDTQLHQRKDDGRTYGLGVSEPVVHLPEPDKRPLRAFPSKKNSDGFNMTDEQIFRKALKYVKDRTDEKELRRAFEDEKHHALACHNARHNRDEQNQNLHRVLKKRYWNRYLEDGLVAPPRQRRRADGLVRGDLGEADEDVDVGSVFTYPDSWDHADGGWDRDDDGSYQEEEEEEVAEEVDEQEQVVEVDLSVEQMLEMELLPDARIEEVGSEEASELDVVDGVNVEAEHVVYEDYVEDEGEDEDEDEDELVLPQTRLSAASLQKHIRRVEERVEVKILSDDQVVEDDELALPQPSSAAKKAASASKKKAKQKAAKEKAAKEKAAKEKTVKETATKEKAAKESAIKEKALRERVAKKAKAAKEKAAMEMAAKENAAKEKAAKEQAAKEKDAEEKAIPKMGPPKKVTSKKAAPKKAGPKKVTPKQANRAASPEVVLPAPSLMSEMSSTSSYAEARRARRRARRSRGAERRRSEKESEASFALSSEAGMLSSEAGVLSSEA